MLGADLPEAVRTRLLRRADWRFLLRHPMPGRTLCYARGMLRDAAAAISGSVATDTRDGDRDFDLAIGVDPDQITLEAAWDARVKKLQIYGGGVNNPKPAPDAKRPDSWWTFHLTSAPPG